MEGGRRTKTREGCFYGSVTVSACTHNADLATAAPKTEEKNTRAFKSAGGPGPSVLFLRRLFAASLPRP